MMIDKLLPVFGVFLWAAAASAQTLPAPGQPGTVVLPPPPATAPPVPAYSDVQPVPAPVALSPEEESFQRFLGSFRQQALGQGISAGTLDAILPGLTYNARVVSLDRAQPETTSTAPLPNLASYIAGHVDGDRIARGRNAYQAMNADLTRIQAQTGVPGEVLVAIWGVETSYGGFVGNFDLFRSLATLAYDGRRRELFTRELIAALRIVDRGLATRSTLVGSWAGATGQPQFLPSVYLATAIDGDGDGRADIWRSSVDALASIGNYLRKAGWRPGLPWGVSASVPPGLDRQRIRNLVRAKSCPRVMERHSRWLTLAEWRAIGVVPLTAINYPADTLATLIEPDGPGQRAFLTFGNYRAILDYNCSNYYALSVGYLADAVSR